MNMQIQQQVLLQQLNLKGKESNVEIESIPVAKKEALRKLLVNKYKADPKDIEKMFNQFDKIRGTWSELFTGMGRRFTP